MDRVIAPSQYIKDVAVMNGIPGDIIEVVPHFTGKNLKNEWVEPEENTILFVGRTDPLKGISEFIEALSFLNDQTWKAYIIGTGEGMSEYEKTAEEFGIKDRIYFLRGLDYSDLDRYYQKASIVVFPSMSPESFGLVGIEAMSFGRPVVAFDVGGPREWLVDGETGFLVKRGDIQGLSQRIVQLIDNDSLTKKMGLEGMKRINESYRKENHFKKLLTVYEEVIQRRS